MSELLKALLDPETMEQALERNDFLQLFYDRCIGRLVESVGQAHDREQPTPAVSLAVIVDLLCFCVQHHTYRIKYYILRNNVACRLLGLLRRRERWLAVAAVRFFRTLVGLKVKGARCLRAHSCSQLTFMMRFSF